MAGAATCVTMPAMQKMFRDMARYRHERTAFIISHRTIKQSLFAERDYLRNDHDDSIDSPYLCAACGYMSASKDAPCAFCRATEWIDLQDSTVVDELRSEEENRRHAIPLSAKIATLLLAVASAAALTVGSIHVVSSVYSDRSDGWVWALLVGVVLTVATPVLLWMFSLRYVAKGLWRLRVHRPVRWRLPIGIVSIKAADRNRRNRQGGGFSGTNSQVAPLTGRACLAWKVSVLFDVHGDARPPEWILEESANGEFHFNGQPVARDRLLLLMTGEPVSADSVEASGRFAEYLKSRGLFLSDGEFRFFESILEANDQKEGFFDPNSGILIVTQGLRQENIRPAIISL